VKSVYNLVSYLGFDVSISNDAHEIQSATHIILPGVGSFASAMLKITKQLPLRILEKEIFNSKKPILGICVGMQVFVEKGYEHGENKGLGWITGSVKKLKVKVEPLPHIGWNNVTLKKDSILFNGLDEINDFYFVHSYAVKTGDSYTVATTSYESEFCSSLQKENIYGVQFHPEKSQKAGQKLIQNFLKKT
jgi:glutamine amidotransferase